MGHSTTYSREPRIYQHATEHINAQKPGLRVAQSFQGLVHLEFLAIDLLTCLAGTLDGEEALVGHEKWR
jgi:hypothetical protein